MKFRLEAQSAFLIAVLGLAPALPGFAQSSSRLPDANDIPLRAGWEIQSGCKIKADGAKLSSADYQTARLDQGHGSNHCSCSAGGSRNLS